MPKPAADGHDLIIASLALLCQPAWTGVICGFVRVRVRVRNNYVRMSVVACVCVLEGVIIRELGIEMENGTESEGLVPTNADDATAASASAAQAGLID